MPSTKSNTRMLDGSIPDSQLESGVGTSANNLVKLDANANLIVGASTTAGDTSNDKSVIAGANITWSVMRLR